MAIVLVGGLAAGCQALPAQTPTPTPPEAPEPAAGFSRVAVIDAGGSIYVVDADGGSRVDINSTGTILDAALVWSPDDGQLAFSRVSAGRSELVVVEPTGANAVTVYRESASTAPFYLYWSPDGERIAFLTPHPRQRMSLNVASAAESDSSRAIAYGQPNYFSWAPHGDQLAVHIGGQAGYVGTYSLADPEPERLADDPALFQSPAWSPDGSAYLYARAAQAQDELVLARGGDRRVLARFRGGIAFGWSPAGGHLAYTTLGFTDFVYMGITVVDATDGTAHTLVRDPILAFFWSPDGTRLAYLTSRLSEPGTIGRGPGFALPAIQAGSPHQWTWHVIDVQSGEVAALATFEPTSQFRFIVPFFDQYAQSISLWSPDGQYLLLAGRPAGRESGIYRIDTTAIDDERLTRIGPGQFAAWSRH